MISESLSRPKSRWSRSPASPHQFARSAIWVVGWLITAGVHSVVWILAMRAALTSRAFSNRWSSDHDGYSARSRSQIALCSRVNSVWSMVSPSQKPGTMAGLCSGSVGSGTSPSGPTRSLPCSPLRANRCCSGVVP